MLRATHEHSDILWLRADELAVLELNAVITQTLFRKFFERLVLEVIPLLEDAEILDSIARSVR